MEAFRRVYILNARNASSLSRHDLQCLQSRVFGSQLSRGDLSALDANSHILKTPTEGSAPTNECFTYEQFVHMLGDFLHRGRPENIWHILRYYGYNGGLVLDEGYLYPKMRGKPDDSETWDMSTEGWSFVDKLWSDFVEVRS